MLPGESGGPSAPAPAPTRRGGGRFRAAFRVLAHGGPGSLLRRARRFAAKRLEERTPLDEACRRALEEGTAPDVLRLLSERADGLLHPPRIDVVLVRRRSAGPPGAAREKIALALRAYRHASISGETLPEDADGPALVSLLERLTGDFLFLVREGDSLRPGAIAEAALFAHEHPSLSFLFGDEEAPHAGTDRTVPLWKPGWSPDLFRSAFYTGWPVVVRRTDALSAARGLGGRGAAALYGLLLRLHEREGSVLHVASILGRRGTPLEADRAGGEDGAMRRALAAWAEPRIAGASVEAGRVPGSWRLRRPGPGGRSVSVIIPTRDGRRWLERCVPGVREERPREILVVDNGSRDPACLEYLAALESRGEARVLRRPGPFDFSSMMNGAARAASGDHLLFLNDDTEVLEKGSIEAMAEEAERPDVAAVGALLLYPDGKIQHAGLVVGMGVVAGHVYKGGETGGVPFFVSPELPREVSAVDGACFLVRKELFLGLGGFDEEHLPVSFSDVDFCLRARERGLRILFTPHARFLHHETRSRSPDLDEREVAWMERRWGDRLTADPFYHPALSLLSEAPRPRRGGRSR
ncbi:MAG: glycosyltransferase family 2 protein [Candidatus Eisenbacteria bacterium]